MAYKSTRRQWVKLWVNEWLDGTTRFELTAQQRLLWIDLLALAGRSRFPGFIYAGDGQGSEKIGYPIAYLAGVLQMDEQSLNNALILLQDHKHITIQEPSPERFIIGISNWEKYQSEYLRQRAYRKVTNQNTSRLLVDVEVEEEVDKRKITTNTVARSARTKSKMPPDFSLTGKMKEFALDRGLVPETELEKFKDYHRPRENRFSDWEAVWRTWCRNAVAIRERSKSGESLSKHEQRQRRTLESYRRSVERDRQEVGSEVCPELPSRGH